jgi:hypothetical protein
MSRKFRTPDYEATLSTPILFGKALPADHLARFVVDIISQLDLSKIYAGYAERGGEAIAPEVLMGLLFYGYAKRWFETTRLSDYPAIPFSCAPPGIGAGRRSPLRGSSVAAAPKSGPYGI